MLTDTGSMALIVTALLVGITHTILGPDHYVPFAALGRARGWKLGRTLWITFICGFGHVTGSVLIGAVGLALGWSLGGLEAIESFRGTIAAWLLTVFGLLYLVWAIKRLGREHAHSHLHVHADGRIHDHEHDHHGSHAHPHLESNRQSATAWSLFIIFVFGPCEAFIPILLFPAVQHNLPLAVGTTLVFGLATILTMLSMVYLIVKGLAVLPFKRYQKYGHVAAGLVILACGAAIHLGL